MNPIFITTQEALNKAIKAALQEHLQRLLPEAVKQATAKEYLTKKELMKLTGWSSRQVEYKKSKREISFIRRGRLVLFPTQDVYEYLNQGYVPPKSKNK